MSHYAALDLALAELTGPTHTDKQYYLASILAAAETGGELKPEVSRWICSGVARAIHGKTSLDVGLGLRQPGTRQKSILRGAVVTARNALYRDAGDRLEGSARERAIVLYRRLQRLLRGGYPLDETDVRLKVSLRYGTPLSAESIRRVLGA